MADIGSKGIRDTAPLPTTHATGDSPGGSGAGAGERRGARSPPGWSLADSATEISGLASTMNGLHRLQLADRERFKAAMLEVAGALKNDAGAAIGEEARSLAQLAGTFDEAALTGAMPVLLLPGSTSRGHHGVRSYAAQQSSGHSDGPRESLDLARLIETALRRVGA